MTEKYPVLPIEQVLLGKTPKEVFSGVALLSNVSKRPTKTAGKFFMVGDLSVKEKTVGFKAWGNSKAFETLDSELEAGNNPSGAVAVLANLDLYQGNASLTLEEIGAAADGTFDEKDLRHYKYELETLKKGLYNLMSKQLSPGGYEVFEALYSQVEERFNLEFAAKSHHDNVPSGLLAHSLKVGRHASVTLQLYPEMFTKKLAEGEAWAGPGKTALVDRDLLILATTFHDIGKVDEYRDGEMAPFAFLNHRYFGLKYVENIKELIVNHFDEMWYNKFLSVIIQHHDEWGDRAKTREALLVHWIDMQESQMTAMSETITSAVGPGTIRVNGKYLD